MQVATHHGSFHADEVFAVAALGLLPEPLEIVRTRDPELLATADLRVDVGFRHDPATGDFDHHQRDFDLVRDNGVGYASFGLIWREFGARICDGDQEVADVVEETLVQSVDANDTGQRITESLIEGVRPMTVNGVIGGFNARWDEDLPAEEERERFDAAVELASGILAREIASAASGRRAIRIVRDAIAAAADSGNPRVVTLPDNVPWKQVVVTEAPEALLVIYPKRQGFGVETVPAALGTFDNRLDLPEEWAGLENDDLVRVSGVEDALFCHVKRFLAVARSKAGAERLAELALADAAAAQPGQSGPEPSLSTRRR
ncbi:MAG: MYG1 family protein [Solirubrobacterales bacterium]